MSSAPRSDWDRVFADDQTRLIRSIYSDDQGHIGECQALFDDRGGAELSLLIGRKSLWNQGYGGAAMLKMLGRLFHDGGLRRAWVSVPRDNHSALRLFTRLGFAPGDGPDGPVLDSRVLFLSAADHAGLAARRPRPPLPVVTVTGLPGSGSQHVAVEVARALNVELADDAITSDLCRMLKRTVGEFRALESSYRSTWSRVLRALLAPWEHYGVYDTGGDWLGPFPPPYYADPTGYLTKKEYTDGLRAVISTISSRHGVVIHGRASNVLLPKSRTALRVFTDVALASRMSEMRREHQIGSRSVRAVLRQADREFRAVHRGLFDMDPLDPTQYDVSLNMDRLSAAEAARIVAGAVRSMVEEPPAVAPASRSLESAAN
jgi:cytidylate kinase